MEALKFSTKVGWALTCVYWLLSHHHPPATNLCYTKYLSTTNMQNVHWFWNGFVCGVSQVFFLPYFTLLHSILFSLEIWILLGCLHNTFTFYSLLFSFHWVLCFVPDLFVSSIYLCANIASDYLILNLKNGVGNAMVETLYGSKMGYISPYPKAIAARCL